METEREYLEARAFGSLHTESAGDYLLPDYNTDVRRVLLTKATANDTGCFVNGDALDVTGAVHYEIVYIDSEGELTSCRFSTDFDTSVKCTEDSVGCEAHTRVCGYSVRLVGPRRFSVKAQLATDYNVTQKAKMTVEGSTFTIGEPETRTENASVAFRSYAMPTEKSYSEPFCDMEGVIADDVVLLFSEVNPELFASLGDGVIEVSGTLHVCCLVKVGDEVPRAVSADIAVNEELAFEGASGAVGCSAQARVNALCINTVPNDEGVSLVADFAVEYSASAVLCSELPIILDCYLTDREVENTYGKFDYNEYLGAAKINESLTLTPTFSEVGAEALREILLTDAYIRVDDVIPSDNCAKMNGIIRFSGVACQINEDGELSYTGIKHDAPFTINVNYTCHLPAETRFVFNGGVTSVCALTTAEGVELNARIFGTLDAIGQRQITRLLASSADGEPIEKACSVISVYYPAEGETLFDVGRKFHARPIDIAADNSLTEEVFSSEASDLGTLGVKRLVIR